MPSPRYWREIPGRYRLEAGRCRECGHLAYPARRLCPSCRGRDLEVVRLSRRAKVITSTVIHVAPGGFQMEAPYAMAVVETPEGARLTTQIVDCDPAQVRPGMEIALEFRRIGREGRGGILRYGHKGVPVT